MSIFSQDLTDFLNLKKPNTIFLMIVDYCSGNIKIPQFFRQEYDIVGTSVFILYIIHTYQGTKYIEVRVGILVN